MSDGQPNSVASFEFRMEERYDTVNIIVHHKGEEPGGGYGLCLPIELMLLPPETIVWLTTLSYYTRAFYDVNDIGSFDANQCIRFAVYYATHRLKVENGNKKITSS